MTPDHLGAAPMDWPLSAAVGIALVWLVVLAVVTRGPDNERNER